MIQSRAVMVPSLLSMFAILVKNKRTFSDYSCAVHVEKCRGQTVIIKNKRMLEMKMKKFIEDGPDKLQIVSDFDHTISVFKLKDVRSRSTHAVIESVIPLDAQKKCREFAEYYYPFEISSSLDLRTKSDLMQEWTIKCHDVLVQSRLTRGDIMKSVRDSYAQNKVALRQGVDIFFQIVHEENIPILVFSAGIGDVVEELLRQGLVLVSTTSKPEASIDVTAAAATTTTTTNSKFNSNSLLPDNIHVVSNRMKFSGSNQHDSLIGFEDLVFHVFNKKGTSIPNSSFLRIHDIKKRINLLLIGDSLGDPHMSDGLSCTEDCIIKIGYLNDHLDRLPAYLDAFDIVILGDPSFDIPVGFLKDIVYNGRTKTSSPAAVTTTLE